MGEENTTDSLNQQDVIENGGSQSIQAWPVALSEESKKVILNLLKQELEEARKDILKTARVDASEEIKSQVQTDKASLITVFGIFASIISFLTIEFQFLRTICSFEKLIGFTLILCSLLLCFNIGLDYLVKSRTDSETAKPERIFSVFVIILFIIGICITSFLGNEEKCNNNKIYEKYSAEFTSQQDDFNKSYKNDLEQKYRELENKILNVQNQIKI